ncbi:hypothetical protein R6Q59_004962 [Mikania micrantha]
MRPAAKNMTTDSCIGEEFDELKRGAWTVEEDSLLIHYINRHGDGRWNTLAKSAGLKRTGKSCRLRWLNYLKPDTKRGNLTPQEQLLILNLHSKWGNRWSKIARHLPGRTDNEIKNYWRTRVQKQTRHLKIDSGSQRFVEALQRFWMPRLLEKVEQSSSSSINSTASTLTAETSQNKLTADHFQTKETPCTCTCTSSSSLQPNIWASDTCGKMLPEMYGDSAVCSLQDIEFCYIETTNELDLGSDTLNFQLPPDNDRIRSDDMAADMDYWNMDELW